MAGTVASPTPIVPICEDSTTVTVMPRRLRRCRSDAAVIHPAVPPPRMTTEMMGPGVRAPFMPHVRRGVAMTLGEDCAAVQPRGTAALSCRDPVDSLARRAPHDWRTT